MGCQLRPLDNDELQVLELVRAFVPELLEAEDRDAWMTGDYRTSAVATTSMPHCSRCNSHGPSWLCGLNLTKN